jgi:signal transduction histidine kinase
MKYLDTLIEKTKTLSLLYVEDNRETRLGTMETLTIFFDNVTPAVDGQDAIEKFLAGKFDFIITDINMPNLNGIEMIKKIRDIDSNIPIVIISAHDETSYFTKTIRFGIEAYLLKPFLMEDLIAVFQKITEHIFMKQELNEYKISLEKKVQEQVEKLNHQNNFMTHQARLASMGEMINSIAHQWRQPLNRINSCVAVLGSIQNSNVEMNEMILSKLESIEQNTKYMSDTIEDFANFFHPNKEQTTFTLQDVVQKALALIVSRTKNVNIIIDAKEEIEISSFENEYQQVILTILHNAIDNFELKSIANPRIDIVLKMNNYNPYLSIQDNGGGIECEDIDRIFEPYYTTKFSAEGTGLGLYMAKMIVESSMGGYLRVQNRDNGACFTIETPKRER